MCNHCRMQITTAPGCSEHHTPGQHPGGRGRNFQRGAPVTNSSRARNSVAAAVAATLLLARYANAADADAGSVAAPPDTSGSQKPALEEIVVTGSRIRREAADITTNEPLNIVS